MTTATATNTTASAMSYRSTPARSSRAYAVALIAKPAAESSSRRSAARPSGARRSAKVTRQWPANETQNATIQPAALASAGDNAARSTSSTATAQCTVAAAAPTAQNDNRRRQ